MLSQIITRLDNVLLRRPCLVNGPVAHPRQIAVENLKISTHVHGQIIVTMLRLHLSFPATIPAAALLVPAVKLLVKAEVGHTMRQLQIVIPTRYAAIQLPQLVHNNQQPPQLPNPVAPSRIIPVREHSFWVQAGPLVLLLWRELP